MLTANDVQKLKLISRFLQEGTFTLKGRDVSSFLECRVWLQDFIDKKPELEAGKDNADQ